ncbi:hypothetical protein UlMin_030752 [Ulmus minor]
MISILFLDLNFFKEIYVIIWILIPLFTLVLGITIGVLIIAWLKRKISTGILQHIEPEYTGPLGVLQALADRTNLLFKEKLLPSRGDTHLFSIGPSTTVISILVSYLVVPFEYRLALADLNIDVFYFILWIVILSIVPIGLLISGYKSNNGLGVAAEKIMPSITFVNIYLFNLHYLWHQPIGMVYHFLIYSLAECERLPSDLLEAKEKLVADYQTKYSSIKFGLFYVASYLNLLVSSLFVTILYSGGWNIFIPFLFISELFEINTTYRVFELIIGIFITLVKTYLFLFMFGQKSVLTILPSKRVSWLRVTPYYSRVQCHGPSTWVQRDSLLPWLYTMAHLGSYA